MTKKHTIEIFIKKAKEIHGDRYDYSLVSYNGISQKIKILCQIHGVFKQEPGVHLKGHGCPQCGLQKRTYKEFIKKAEEKHGDLYDYSLVVYIKIDQKIKIKCPIHGVFKQTPGNHYRHGCQKCKKTAKLTINEFILRSQQTHKNKYDYSKTIFKNTITEVEIICPIHGIFKQKPGYHYRGSGCQKCALEKKSDLKSDTIKFISKSKKIHGNKYDYSLVYYNGCRVKTEIICSIHGVFKQRPNDHLSGYGCPKCGYLRQLGLQSKISQNWLDDVKIEIREHRITLNNGKKISVDGYDPKTNTVYEFYGDFWHGNPKTQDPNKINPFNKKTFGELYEATQNRRVDLEALGYKVVEMWENDYKNTLN